MKNVVKTCKDCKLWGKDCILDTDYIPKYIAKDQRQRWIEVWYNKAQYQEVCENYE